MIMLAQSLRHARLRAIAMALDSAAQGGQIRVYAAPRVPLNATPGAPVLAELYLANPCTLSLAAGLLTLKAPPERLCLQTGVAHWARLLDGDGHTLLDVDIGLLGSDAELQLDRIDLLAGAAVRITSLAFYEP